MKRPAALPDLFSALADETRLRILHLVADQEVCVCFFIEALEEPQSKISRHLAFLRRAGLVHARREGKWMHYRIAWPADKAQRRVVEAAIAAVAEQPRGRQDKRQLDKACCGPNSLINILGAPKPVGL